MKKLLSFLMIVTLSVNAESINLNVGDLAPFKGVLTDYETSRKVMDDLNRLDVVESINTSLNNSIEMYKEVLSNNEQQHKLLRDSNNRLRDRIEKSESVTSLERVLWFSLGVLGTGFAIKAAKELN